jgi:heme/copper-type cytochrome/quinol oxidase subunit 2
MKAFVALIGALCLAMQPAWALDSYRFAHVTIETPWLIFIFLLVVIMLPFIIMAVLSWYYAAKKEPASDSSESK